MLYSVGEKKKNTILGGKQGAFAISTENNHVSHLCIFMATNQDCSNVTQQLSTQNFPYIRMKHRLWLQDECFKTRPFRQPLLERVSLACYSPGTCCHANHFPPRGVRELMDKAASEQVCWTPGRRWGGKHRESAFPPRQVPRQNVTDVTVPELWSLPETGSFQGKDWKVNCLYFLSISALSSPAVTHPNLHPMAGSCAPVPKAAGMKSARARVAKKDLVLQKSGVYVLVTGCRFWS